MGNCQISKEIQGLVSWIPGAGVPVDEARWKVKEGKKKKYTRGEYLWNTTKIPFYRSVGKYTCTRPPIRPTSRTRYIQCTYESLNRVSAWNWVSRHIEPWLSCPQTTKHWMLDSIHMTYTTSINVFVYQRKYHAFTWLFVSDLSIPTDFFVPLVFLFLLFPSSWNINSNSIKFSTLFAWIFMDVVGRSSYVWMAYVNDATHTP